MRLVVHGAPRHCQRDSNVARCATIRQASHCHENVPAKTKREKIIIITKMGPRAARDCMHEGNFVYSDSYYVTLGAVKRDGGSVTWKKQVFFLVRETKDGGGGGGPSRLKRALIWAEYLLRLRKEEGADPDVCRAWNTSSIM